MFNYTLIPTSVDVRRTPTIPFSYFDPDRGAYQNLTIPSLPLLVKPGLQVTNAQTVAQAESPGTSRAKERRLSELATTRGAIATSLVPLPLRAWFPFLQIAPVLGFIALWAWDRRRRFLERHPDIVVRRRARRELRRARRRLRNAVSHSDAEGVASWGVKAMRVAVAPHFPAEPRALVGADVLSLLGEEDRQEFQGAIVRRWFEVADAARFDTKPAVLVACRLRTLKLNECSTNWRRSCDHCASQTDSRYRVVDAWPCRRLAQTPERMVSTRQRSLSRQGFRRVSAGVPPVRRATTGRRCAAKSRLG